MPDFIPNPDDGYRAYCAGYTMHNVFKSMQGYPGPCFHLIGGRMVTLDMEPPSDDLKARGYARSILPRPGGYVPFWEIVCGEFMVFPT